MNYICKTVKKLMIDQNIKQTEIAKTLNTSSAYISAINAGKKKLTVKILKIYIEILAKNSKENKLLLIDSYIESIDEIKINLKDFNKESKKIILENVKKSIIKSLF